MSVLLASFVTVRVVIHEDWSADSIAETHARDDRVLAATLAYRAHHGSFPADLEHLVPEYIDEIQPPLVGEGVWTYTTLARPEEDRCRLAVYSRHRDTTVLNLLFPRSVHRESHWSDWGISDPGAGR